MINLNTAAPPSPKMRTIGVVGPDAAKFLQGQITCDVNSLADGAITLGAYCNIKGKVESIFYLERAGNDYYLHLHPDLLESTLKELKKYSVFSKVTLDNVERALPAIAQLSDAEAILAKIPQLYSQTIAEFFPHDLNLPALGAVSFTKGCYRGQEIVARMQYRGKLKRSLYFFSCDAECINPGDVVSATSANAGTVVRVCKNQAGKTIGLAVITDALLAEQLKIHNSIIAVS